MNCPKCGGETWDETRSKFWGDGIDPKTKKPKPIAKCKDKSCGGKVYGGTGGPSNGGTAATTQPAATAPTPPSTEVAAGVWTIYKTFAVKYCDEIIPKLRLSGVEVTHEGTSAAIATMLIAANERH